MRVTIGWRKKGLMELIATNHGGRIRNDTETAGALGRAMDEQPNKIVRWAFHRLKGWD
jgi:hypothetical protein